jgi:23S rRNA (adenine-N6)-dimethyltransferase
MYNRGKRDKHIKYAQNFVKNPSLVRWIIKKSTITPADTVIEIGPGRGIITEELSKRADKVIAVEKDLKLFNALKNKLQKRSNIKLVHCDFLNYKIRESSYKIFSNPPFNTTSKVIKRLIKLTPAPADTYLFVQKEAAVRFCSARRDYEFTLSTKPWFNIRILHQFKRTDFTPAPSVDVVLLQIEAKKRPLLSKDLQTVYTKFVQYGFRMQQGSLKKNYKNIFTYKQWKRLARDLGFSTDAQPFDLNLRQWIELFTFFNEQISAEKKLTLRVSRNRGN